MTKEERKMTIYYPVRLESYRDSQRIVLDWGIPAYTFEEFLQEFHANKHTVMKASKIKTPTPSDCRDYAEAIVLVLVSVPSVCLYQNMTVKQLEDFRESTVAKIRELALDRGEVAYVPAELINAHYSVMQALIEDTGQWEYTNIEQPREAVKRFKEDEEKERKADKARADAIVNNIVSACPSRVDKHNSVREAAEKLEKVAATAALTSATADRHFKESMKSATEAKPTQEADARGYTIEPVVILDTLEAKHKNAKYRVIEPETLGQKIKKFFGGK